jgi:SET domain-containing protein
MDNPKAEVRKAKHGKGVFAKQKIKKGELVASIDGRILGWYSKWTHYNTTHAIQFAKRKWRLSKGFATLLNHSCEPNCGIKNLFDIVAMRDIRPGEELTWDYEMTERSGSCSGSSKNSGVGIWKKRVLMN